MQCEKRLAMGTGAPGRRHECKRLDAVTQRRGYVARKQRWDTLDDSAGKEPVAVGLSTDSSQ